jgi:Cu-processing system ATP-binding protein
MIRLEGIRKRYGALEVLKGVDLEVEAGRITAITGPNGSGKTTLIKMILGLTKPDAGRIVWNGVTLNGDCAYRAGIGYMPQIVRFPENLSGRELLAMISDLRRTQEGDPDLVHRFGLEQELDKPFRTLSGGTRQKINACLAFRFSPRLLILDEPTSGLDPIAARALKDRIRVERDAGKSVILSSHVLSELEALADDVAFLLDGRIRYRGTLADLKDGTGESELEGAIASLMTAGAVE